MDVHTRVVVSAAGSYDGKVGTVVNTFPKDRPPSVVVKMDNVKVMLLLPLASVTECMPYVSEATLNDLFAATTSRLADIVVAAAPAVTGALRQHDPARAKTRADTIMRLCGAKSAICQLQLLEGLAWFDARTTEPGSDCVICMSSPKTVAAVPCGHMVTCSACPVTSKCPVCRQPVESLLRVYK